MWRQPLAGDPTGSAPVKRKGKALSPMTIMYLIYNAITYLSAAAAAAVGRWMALRWNTRRGGAGSKSAIPMKYWRALCDISFRE